MLRVRHDMPDDLYLCGWRVSSHIHLPSLPRWRGDDRNPDVTVRLGDVAGDFRAEPGKVDLQTSDRNVCRFHVPTVAAFEIRNGREVVVRPEPGASPPDVRACISGIVLGFLCLLRNLLPLHAGCVRMGSGAVCFTGRSGAGKSTLAAALAQRGHRVLSDDVCAIDVSAEGPVVLPSFPALRLGDLSVHAVGLPGRNGRHLGRDRFKQHLLFTPAETIPTRLSAVYRLEALESVSGAAVRDQRGAESLILLQHEIYRYDAARRLGLGNALFSAAARVCSSTPVRVLARRFDFRSLGETVRLLERLHCDGAC
jgi:hypothetical protein